MAVHYYSVGTATLTAGSDVMAGQDTLWVGNVRPGDQVVSYAGETAIVGAINSNTSITLARAFQGASQASAAYEIVYTPDDPFTQTLARQVLQAISGSALVGLGGVTPAARKLPYFDATSAAALTDLSDSGRALLALVGAADKLGYYDGTGTAALTDLSAFARTLLDDADAATARNTLGINTAAGQSNAPVRIRNGDNAIEFGHSTTGYGSTLAAEGYSGNPFLMFFGEHGSIPNTYRTRGKAGIGFRGRATDSGLDFIRAANINADDQTATVIASLDPDGAFRQNGVKIVDYGSNANGAYVRLSNGVQWCWQQSPTSFATTSGVGSVFASISGVFTFSAAFATPPTISPGVLFASGTAPWASLTAVTATTATIVLLSALSSGAGYPSYTATGRWL